MDVRQVRIILRSCVSGSTHEIAEVAEDKARHDCIEIDNTDRSALFIKEHIIHFRIAVVDVFGQFALPEQTLREAHIFASFVDFIDNILTSIESFSAYIGRRKCFRFGNCLIELLQSVFHVMEIRYRLAQGIKRQVSQLALETSERFSCQFRRRRRHFFLRGSGFDQYIQTPIIALRGLVKQFTLFGGH